ncbi:hypothetical protein H6P81_009948 [Aristolochia fimbriata]|uniref:G domain-containing protein n=1 Tax=Aristolochia fimbriata TaxID=158543 RepID=A0AAV7EMH6_ARIFI|nr:hypothetical protein H6P81_009948 [Aristolochia fimbriata]
MNPPISLSLLFKLSAASLSGASFFLAWQHSRRCDVLAAQQAEIRHALRDAGRLPPVIFIIGFRGHGKSSFVNTVCRVLAEEDGQLVFRSETAPVGPTKTTTVPRPVRAGRGTVALVDTPGLPTERLTRVHTETALAPLPGGGATAECAVVVLRCEYMRFSERQILMKRIMEISSVLRAKGLPFVVLLTHKRAMKKAKEAEELRKELALRAKTDCVYFVENYVSAGCSSTSFGWKNGNRSISVKNNFDTHSVTLAVMRQCVEFVATRRTDLQRLQTEPSDLLPPPSGGFSLPNFGNPELSMDSILNSE